MRRTDCPPDMHDDLAALLAGDLTHAEQRVRDHLADARPELLDAYLAALPGARLALLERLLNALLREGALKVEASGPTRVSVQAIGGRLDVPVSRRRAYGRIEVVGPIRTVHAFSGSVATLRHPLELIIRVADPEGAWDVLAREVCDGCAFLALARAFWTGKRADLRAKAGVMGAPDALALARGLAARGEGPAAIFFERLCVEGHLLHPGAKTRLGLTPEAVLAFGPEFDGTPALQLVAVERSLLAWDGVGDPALPLFQGRPALQAAAEAAMAAHGLDPRAYGIVPVHPHQLAQGLPAAYGPELAAGAIVPLGVAIPCDATASFRTLAARDGGAVAYKVALDAQMTSTVRSISPQTALNAAAVSAMLRGIFARDDGLAGLVPVLELGGVCFRPPASEPAGNLRERRARNLTTVFRVDPASLAGPDETPVVATALYAESPVTGRPVLDELISRYGRCHGLPAGPAARAYVRVYAQTVVPGCLRLLTGWGVALEAHLQNCVPLIGPDGAPTRMLVRDWGGARFDLRRLAARGVDVDLAPGSVTVARDPEQARAKLHYTLFQNHLAEVVAIAASHAGCDEAPFWADIREICRATYAGLAAELPGRPQVRADWAALDAPAAPHKALARMRLAPGHGDKYVQVANPLAGGAMPW